ncbi:MAG: Uma2 family endonuclease [Aridibacter sp.]
MSAVLEKQKQKTTVPQTNGSVFTLHLLRVEDYDKMIEHGVFNEDEKIELWDGVIIKMSPKGIKHRNATTKTTDYFYEFLRKKSLIQVQDPIRLDDFSEPEPDIVLAESPLSRYASRHPAPKDIYLIIEIAESSIQIDRRKALKYAQNGIRQYLILNLNTNEIEDYREPSEDGYRFKKTYTAEESFELVAFPEVEIKVSDLLPPLKASEGKQGVK